MARKVYTIEDKKRILQEVYELRARNNLSLPEVAKELKVNQHTLTRWVARYGSEVVKDMANGNSNTSVQALQAENLELKITIANLVRDLQKLGEKLPISDGHGKGRGMERA